MTLCSVRWSPADAVLVDEAADLVERTPSLGHVVADEAQDLSPMMLRAVKAPRELATEGERVDLDAVWAFLSTDAYWGRERSREVVERQFADVI